MGQFGDTAVEAVKILAATGQTTDPRKAWETAARKIMSNSPASQKKGCPRVAFLGLCEEGLVKGVPRGNYTGSTKKKKNKDYAVRMANYLITHPGIANTPDPQTLWQIALAGEANPPASENGQTDVVLSLWKAGRLA